MKLFAPAFLRGLLGRNRRMVGNCRREALQGADSVLGRNISARGKLAKFLLQFGRKSIAHGNNQRVHRATEKIRVELREAFGDDVLSILNVAASGCRYVLAHGLKIDEGDVLDLRHLGLNILGTGKVNEGKGAASPLCITNHVGSEHRRSCAAA